MSDQPPARDSSDPDPEGRTTDPAGLLPRWIVVAGAAAWRLLAIGAVVYFGFQVLRTVSVVALAVVIALFPTAVLWRPVRWLERRRWPAGLAALAVVAGTLGAITGVGFLIAPAVSSNVGDITGDLDEAGESIRNWLTDGPLGLSAEQLDQYWNSATESFSDGNTLTSGLLGGASAAVEVVTGLILVLVVSFFLLKDGERMLQALYRRVPPERRNAVERGTSAGGHALSRYMAGLALIGLVDAVFIGLGLLILGVPLVLPLSILVFFGAFFPVIGAFTTGLVAVAVAFVNGGFGDAVIVLIIITVVQQVEGNVLEPLVFGRTLEMHPLVIVLAVVAGGVAFGIIGAFLFVPVVAVALTVRREVSENPHRSYWALTQGVGSLEDEETS